MGIKINLQRTETELFCSSKWWGDPDLPADMEYPTVEVTDEDGTYGYPLTFVCQIDCEDIAPLDPEGKIPHQGMFYIFAGVDEYLEGFDSPFHNGEGEWGRKMAVVKYTKAINFETFRSAILVDDEDNSLTEAPPKMTFEACADDAPCTRILGIGPEQGLENFLQIVSGTAGLQFPDNGVLSLQYAGKDFAAGKWKLVKARLSGKNSGR
jgi:hypothetical protein